MSATDERCGISTLLQYVAESRRKEFVSYVERLIAEDEGCGIDPSFLGFICDYEQYAKLLERKADVHNPYPASWGYPIEPPLTVYDVGCASALQHVVFDERIHYVGIDIGHGCPDPKFFRPNCTFVRGRFADVVDKLDVHPQSAIGIANMSLYYTCTEDLFCLRSHVPEKVRPMTTRLDLVLQKHPEHEEGVRHARLARPFRQPQVPRLGREDAGGQAGACAGGGRHRRDVPPVQRPPARTPTRPCVSR